MIALSAWRGCHATESDDMACVTIRSEPAVTGEWRSWGNDTYQGMAAAMPPKSTILNGF